MTNPNFSLACNSGKFKNIKENMKNMIYKTDLSFDSLFYKSEQRAINCRPEFRHHNEKFKQTAETTIFKNKTLEANEIKLPVPITPKKSIIIGYPGSGLNLLSRLFNTSVKQFPEFKEEIEIVVIRHDSIDSVVESCDLSDYNMLVIVRNPFILLNKGSLDIDSEFNNWNKVHEKLMHKSVSFFRYEDIGSINLRILEEIFRSVNKIFDRKITKEIEPVNSASFEATVTPGMFQLWKFHKKDLVLLYFGYSEFNLGF